MILLMYISQVLVGHVRINLRGADVGVAEHGLDGSYVGAIAQEVGRVDMPYHMWRYSF